MFRQEPHSFRLADRFVNKDATSGCAAPICGFPVKTVLLDEKLTEGQSLWRQLTCTLSLGQLEMARPHGHS